MKERGCGRARTEEKFRTGPVSRPPRPSRRLLIAPRSRRHFESTPSPPRAPPAPTSRGSDPAQPDPAHRTHCLAAAITGARPRRNPRSAPASPPAPRLRDGRGQPAPPPPARHLIVKPHKGTRVRWGRAFPGDRAHQGAAEAAIGCGQAPQAPLAAAIGCNTRLSRPRAPPRRRWGCHGSRTLPLGRERLRETGAGATRGRPDFKSQPRPRGTSGLPATGSGGNRFRPGRAAARGEPWRGRGEGALASPARALPAVRRQFPPSRGGPGLRPAGMTGGLSTPLARPVAFPVRARPPSPGSRSQSQEPACWGRG